MMHGQKKHQIMKLEVIPLFTFAVRHFPSKDKNRPILEDASTCTE